jgi:hypothetical protein
MAGTLGDMKTRIADELARSDLDGPIATAIGDAIAAYQTDRLFYNNRTTLLPPPASDGEAGNIWMTYAERLIRARAKRELALHWLRDVDLANGMQTAEQVALAELRNRTTGPAPGGPGTLGAMKSTIADEIGRDDLTLQIANAIAADGASPISSPRVSGRRRRRRRLRRGSRRSAPRMRLGTMGQRATPPAPWTLLRRSPRLIRRCSRE